MSLPDWLRRPGPRLFILASCTAFWGFAAVATHLPRRNVPDMDVNDKMLHFGGYFVLASLFWLTLASRRLGRWARAACVLAIIPLYGVLDEVTQPLVGRSCDLMDWLADAAAALAAVAMWETLVRLRRWAIA